MQFLRNLPIKRKLMLIIMGVSSSVLLLAGASFIAYEQAAARKWMAQDLAITAAMAGANSTAGLSFDEPDSVNQALQSLMEQPDIVQACVYDKTGRLFARYARVGITNNAPPIGKAGLQFARDRLRLYQPISLAGEQIGTIYLETDLAQLNARFWHYLQTMALVLATSAAVAFLLSAWLQGLISRPLSDLAGIVTLVATQKNYSVRARKTAADELGRLIDGFNEMLAQIQERDANLERRVAERTLALAESEANYHSLVDQMPAGIYRKNKEGRYVFVNEWFCRFKGIKPEDYLGKSAAELAPAAITSGAVPADAAELVRMAAEHHRLILQNGQPIEVEEAYTLPDGRIIFLQVVKSPVFGPDGTVVGSQAMLLDITQRKQAQERIAREQARLQFIFDSVPVGISLARRTAEGKLAERIINDAHLRICGLTREQNENPTIYRRITHPEDRPRQQKFIELVEAGKIDQYSMEKRYIRPDGKT
ncbi:MAG TPA: PAS domain S-box protein, partial [Verrucomicrobiae bacterium]